MLTQHYTCTLEPQHCNRQHLRLLFNYDLHVLAHISIHGLPPCRLIHTNHMAVKPSLQGSSKQVGASIWYFGCMPIINIGCDGIGHAHRGGKHDHGIASIGSRTTPVFGWIKITTSILCCVLDVQRRITATAKESRIHGCCGHHAIPTDTLYILRSRTMEAIESVHGFWVCIRSALLELIAEGRQYQELLQCQSCSRRKIEILAASLAQIV
jgi:hypothetical protein